MIFVRSLTYKLHIINNYVVFKFSNWNDKHPHASLLNTLGSVDSLDKNALAKTNLKSIYTAVLNYLYFVSGISFTICIYNILFIQDKLWYS